MRRIGLSLLVALITGVLLTAAQKPAFEVVSVKPNSSVSSPPRIASGPDGSLRAINTTLRLLILQAYGAFDYQLVGRPIGSIPYDLTSRQRLPQTLTSRMFSKCFSHYWRTASS